MADPPHQPGQLKRQIGVFHAVLLGLGSILGTGVFVSIGIAAGIAGPAVLVAIVLAGLLALCNGLSSAQLAAAHPVAGGTYEYGYKFLHPKLGFTAGWMFLLAKSASAATAALGVVGYLLSPNSFGNFVVAWVGTGRVVTTLLSVGVIVAITCFVLIGIRRSAQVNFILVSFTIVTIIIAVLYVVAMKGSSDGWSSVLAMRPRYANQPVIATLSATALVFVAYTGYGRIATLGEEVHDPKRTIPIAIFSTLAVSACLYLAVGYAINLPSLSGDRRMMTGINASSTLLSLGYRFYAPGLLHLVFTLGAITAMAGVLINLILGLSRVALAMGRRRDLPGLFSGVNVAGTTPMPAVILVAVIISLLVMLGNVKATWSFSAFTVLIYYGITNLAALKLPVEHRLYPRFFSWAGLAGCLFLAWWVEPVYWIVGSGLIVAGLVWHSLAPKMFGTPPLPGEKCIQCGYDLRASTNTCPECGTTIPTLDNDAHHVPREGEAPAEPQA